MILIDTDHFKRRYHRVWGRDTYVGVAFDQAGRAPRRQRHSAVASSASRNNAAIAPAKKRPPGRSMVRDRSDGASPSLARRKATTLSPIEVPASDWPPAAIATYCSPFQR